MAHYHDSESKVSLGDRRSAGGPIALKGFDFQRAYALTLLVESLADTAFIAVIVEGAEDVEVRFEKEGAVERRAVQVKGYRVTLALAREIIAHFQKLDRDSPSTWGAFAIACTGLDAKLQAIHHLLASYHHPQDFYDAAQDGILANTRADLERKIADAGLPVDFTIERVTFEPGLPDLAQLEAWVRPRVLEALQRTQPEMTRAAAEDAYRRLLVLVSESTRKSIARKQAQTEIASAMEAHPAPGGTGPSVVVEGGRVTTLGIGQIIGDVFIGSRGESWARDRRDKELLLGRVKSSWVEGVLGKIEAVHASFAHDTGLIPLHKRLRPEAVDYSSDPADEVSYLEGVRTYSLPPDKKISDIFDEVGRSLLILGGPGSGKTVTLLELARDAIARAEKDPNQPIPVVLKLSSWADHQPSVADWIVDELNTPKYGIPREIGRKWVSNRDLLLLLDGLDEVSHHHREGCVEAINKFASDYGLPGIVVCCRSEEYDNLETRLELRGAIILESLTPEQIDAYFDAAGPSLTSLRTALQDDAPLRELAQTPLMLNIMSLAYQDESVEALVADHTNSVEDRRKCLLDTYISRMFERGVRAQRELFPKEQAIRWLSWLALRLSEQGEREFFLEGIQASWLTTDDERRLYLGGSRLVLGLIGGLLMGLSAGLMGGLSVGLIGGLVGGLLMLRQVGSGSITTGLSYRWSWTKVRSTPRVVWGAMLIVFLAWGLLSGPRDVGPMIRPFRWLFDNLSWILPSVFLGILFRGLTASEIEERASPNQGMWQLAKSCLLFGLSTALVSQLAFRLAGWLLSEPSDDRLVLTLLSSLVWGLWLALALGGTSFVQHFILRSVLYRSGHMSWNYVRFLDFAVGRILLHRVGGGYVFIHKLLQEHFVGLGIVMGLTTKVEQASVLCGQGRMAEDEQDYAEARRHYAESLGISTEAGYQVGIADALRGLGRIAEAQEDYGEAQSRYREFLEISREAKDQARIADALQRLGHIAEVEEDYAEARRLYRESLEINERLGGREVAVVALGVRLGSIAEMEGDYAEARRRFRKFLELSREVESQAGIAAALYGLGNIAGAEGHYAEANRLYRESLEHDDELMFQEGIARRLYDLGLTSYDQGEHEESGRLFQQSLEIYEKLENRDGIATTLGSLGMMAYVRREYEEAGRLFQRSLKIYEKLENQEGIALSLLRLGRIAAVQGDDNQARSLYQRSHEIFERLQSPYVETTRRCLAELEENATSSHDT